MASTAAYNLWDNHRYSIANFNFNVTVIRLQQLNYSSAPACEILLYDRLANLHSHSNEFVSWNSHSTNAKFDQFRHITTQECHLLKVTQSHWNESFQWLWVTLSDLAKYSMTRSVARSLCESWASCYLRCWLTSMATYSVADPVGLSRMKSSNVFKSQTLQQFLSCVWLQTKFQAPIYSVSRSTVIESECLQCIPMGNLAPCQNNPIITCPFGRGDTLTPFLFCFFFV